jgi:hypothetical protein
VKRNVRPWSVEATADCGCKLSVTYKGKSSDGVLGETCAVHGKDGFASFADVAPLQVHSLVKTAKLYLKHVGAA